jgi:hypothetical protein
MGGVIPSVDPANRQEYDLFPPLLDRVCAMAGTPPQTVIGDRGFSVKKYFEYAMRKGIAPVFRCADTKISMTARTRSPTTVTASCVASIAAAR